MFQNTPRPRYDRRTFKTTSQMRIHYLVLFCLISALSAAADPARWRELRARAEQANRADDCVALRTALTELAPLSPNNPRNIYHHAACNSRLGQRRVALPEAFLAA